MTPETRRPREHTRTARASRARAARRRVFIVAATILAVLIAMAWVLDLPRLTRPITQPITVLRVITGPGTGEKPTFARPLAAGWGPGRDIVVSDTGNARICRFTERGEFVAEFGGPGTKPASSTVDVKLLEMPVGLDTADDGSVYVADLRAGRVAVYDAGGRFVRIFRPPSRKPWRPTDVAVAATLVYVTDETGVETFTRDGAHVERLSIDGKTDTLARPNGIAVGDNGNIYLSDTNQFRVVALDASGTVLYSTGSDTGKRLFGLPRGIGAGVNGTVMVADAFTFSVSELDASGRLVKRWGDQGTQPGRFNYPNDVDSVDGLVLVADKENDRVQVLRLNR